MLIQLLLNIIYDETVSIYSLELAKGEEQMLIQLLLNIIHDERVSIYSLELAKGEEQMLIQLLLIHTIHTWSQTLAVYLSSDKIL